MGQAMKITATIMFVILISFPAIHGQIAHALLQPDIPGAPIQTRISDSREQALARCLMATERVRQTASQMSKIRSTWNKARPGYNQQDLSSLLHLDDQLEESLADLSSAHDEFRSALNHADSILVENQLRKLKKVQLEMRSGAVKVRYDLLGASPGPSSASICWEIARIKRAADRWRTEYRTMAEELALADRKDEYEVQLS